MTKLKRVLLAEHNVNDVELTLVALPLGPLSEVMNYWMAGQRLHTWCCGFSQRQCG